MSPSPAGTGHRTPVTEPQRHSPRSTTGGAGGRAAGEAMPFPRQRSIVGRWTGARSVGSTRRAPPCTSVSCWPTPWSNRTAPGRPNNRGAAAWQRAGSAPATHRRVSCPVHSGACHAGELVDHQGLYGTGCRRHRRAPDTGSLNLNVTPPGLRPGAREGEPQARRCRSRVSAPSSVVGRGCRSAARPVGRRPAQAPRAGQRPAAPI